MFNTTGQRDADKFLEILSTHNFQFGFFTTNKVVSKPGATSDSINFTVSFEEALKTAETNLEFWKKRSRSVNLDNFVVSKIICHITVFANSMILGNCFTICIL